MSHNEIGWLLPVWSVLPFVGIILSIAVIPLINAHFWERHMFKVSAFWSLVFLVPFGFSFTSEIFIYKVLEAVVIDFLPFIVLLFGLFAVTGGIHLKGTLVGTPRRNIALVAAGTFLAGWIGTTGASMLLIRPLIRINGWREKKVHLIVFFIFLVSNIGGCLTPLGDPPLFMGFLKGIDFFWFLRLFPVMIVNAAILLVLLYLIDNHYYKKEISWGRSLETVPAVEPLAIVGAHNFIFLGMIIGAVILSGTVLNFDAFINPATGEIYGLNIYKGLELGYNIIAQMILILLASLFSWLSTKAAVRRDNSFTWDPMLEVAKLFGGIFITLIPVLALLQVRGPELGLTQPAQYFWIPGILSSFLDNTPTFLVFLAVAGSLGATDGVATTVGYIDPRILLALSAGAVFMGAITYVGNAPNFMVRSIAEGSGVKMPGFFRYMAWAVCLLLPLFILDTVLFFL